MQTLSYYETSVPDLSDQITKDRVLFKIKTLFGRMDWCNGWYKTFIKNTFHWVKGPSVFHGNIFGGQTKVIFS